jgi:hypothetical protein
MDADELVSNDPFGRPLRVTRKKKGGTPFFYIATPPRITSIFSGQKSSVVLCLAL